MTKWTRVAQRPLQGAALIGASVMFGVALTFGPTLAFAGAQARGQIGAVSVEAQDASVQEILEALTNSFDIRFRSSTNLEKRLTGKYKGSLQQVVTHILRGYDFVVKSGDKGLEITLLGSGKEFAVIGATSKPMEQRADVAAAASHVTPPFTASALVGPSPTVSIPEGSPPVPIIRLAEETPPVPPIGPSASGSGPTPGPARGTGPIPAPPAPGTPAPVPTVAGSPSPTPQAGSAMTVPVSQGR